MNTVEMAQNIPHSIRTHVFELYGVKVDGVGAPVGKVISDDHAYCVLRSLCRCTFEGLVFNCVGFGYLHLIVLQTSYFGRDYRQRHLVLYKDHASRNAVPF
jgi:hypothetical protein